MFLNRTFISLLYPNLGKCVIGYTLAPLLVMQLFVQPNDLKVFTINQEEYIVDEMSGGKKGYQFPS